MKKKQFRSYEEAHKFVRSIGITKQKDWIQYSKSGKKPENMPGDPYHVYKNQGWTSWGDFLGTGTIGVTKRNFRSFSDTRKFAHSLGFASKSQWDKYGKSGKLPKDIPTHASRTYKEDWKDWGDFLGTGTIATFNKQYRSFKEAKNYVRSLKLQSQREWKQFCKSGKKPDDIPFAPAHTYKNKGWIDWGDWLGTGTVAPQDKIFRPFSSAREFVRSLKIKNRDDWYNFCKSKSRPIDIPTNPNTVYKSEWKGMGDWLGTGTIAPINFQTRSFEKAREFVHALNLKSKTEWTTYCKSDKKPKDIPSTPERSYKNKGWIDWGDWLGTGRTRKFRPFNEAREFVRKLGLKTYEEWEEYCKSGKKPNDIPTTPWNVYKEWKKSRK